MDLSGKTNAEGVRTVPAQGIALGESRDHSDETLKEFAKYRNGYQKIPPPG